MNEQAAAQYQKIKNRLLLFNIIFDGAVLIVFFASGLSQYCADFADAASANVWLGNGVYILIFSAGFSLLHLPVSYYSGYVLEHQFKLSTQKLLQWLVDEFKKGVFGFILFLIVVEVLYYFLKVFPDNWWILASVFWLFLTFALAKLTPNVIIPLFYKYSAIDDPALLEKIKELFKKCHVKCKNIYAINLSSKTKKANAFLCGMGNNRRVVLSDTLIAQFSHDEIEVVIAHELGHYCHRDILKLLLVNTLSTFIGLYGVRIFLMWALQHMNLSRIDDIAFFPMIVLGLTVFGLFSIPVVNSYSRRIERAADRFSLERTGKPAAFISVMEKLAALNLAERSPGRFIEIFLYDHPPIAKRVAFAKQYTGR